MATYTVPVIITLEGELGNAERGRLLGVAIEEALDDRLRDAGFDAEQVVALQPRAGHFRTMTVSQD